MAVLYVARNAKLGRWASDVGLGKHIYKVGVTESEPKAIAAEGWAGEAGWTVVGKQAVEELSDEQAIERLARKEKMIDPKIYPRLKGARGLFRVSPEHVENHLIVTRALAGAGDQTATKPKPADFAAYLIHNALR